MLFSQRHGFKPVKDQIQLHSMDNDLRIGLWNALDIFYWKGKEGHPYTPSHFASTLITGLWLNYYKEPLDTIPDQWNKTRSKIRQGFFSCEWSDAYDFIQFVANHSAYDSVNQNFMEYCNVILEREVSGWRFVGGKIEPITSEEEIAEIEEALESTKSLTPVSTHLKAALDFLADRESPDYRNSIKESISSVEAICSLIADAKKADLTQALKVMKKKGIDVHPALELAFEKLYSYTSDAHGIRHALLEEPDLHLEDAKFMLVSCAAFINYLKLKSSKVGIKLEIS